MVRRFIASERVGVRYGLRKCIRPLCEQLLWALAGPVLEKTQKQLQRQKTTPQIRRDGHYHSTYQRFGINPASFPAKSVLDDTSRTPD